jgi:hypothetical protein
MKPCKVNCTTPIPPCLHINLVSSMCLTQRFSSHCPFKANSALWTGLQQSFSIGQPLISIVQPVVRIVQPLISKVQPLGQYSAAPRQ